MRTASRRAIPVLQFLPTRLSAEMEYLARTKIANEMDLDAMQQNACVSLVTTRAIPKRSTAYVKPAQHSHIQRNYPINGYSELH